MYCASSTLAINHNPIPGYSGKEHACTQAVQEHNLDKKKLKTYKQAHAHLLKKMS